MTRSDQHCNDDLTRLLIRVGQEDTGAFEQLHSALLPAVWDYVASLDGSIDYHRRQDLVQEVFLRTWNSRSRFRGEASARTFVFAIAKNVLREESSRQRKLPTVPVSDLNALAGMYVSDATAPLVDSDQDELSEKIKQAVARLSEVQRQAFDLAYLQGIPQAKAAECADCSIRQFWDRLHRARKRLRQLLRNLPRCSLL